MYITKQYMHHTRENACSELSAPLCVQQLAGAVVTITHTLVLFVYVLYYHRYSTYVLESHSILSAALVDTWVGRSVPHSE